MSNKELKEVSRLFVSTYMYYIIMPNYWVGYVVLNVILKRCTFTQEKHEYQSSLSTMQLQYPMFSKVYL